VILDEKIMNIMVWNYCLRHKPRRVRRPSWYLYLPTKGW